MDFPITDLMDEHACYDRLIALLHLDGLSCLVRPSNLRQSLTGRSLSDVDKYPGTSLLPELIARIWSRNPAKPGEICRDQGGQIPITHDPRY